MTNRFTDEGSRKEDQLGVIGGVNSNRKHTTADFTKTMKKATTVSALGDLASQCNRPIGTSNTGLLTSEDAPSRISDETHYTPP